MLNVILLTVVSTFLLPGIRANHPLAVQHACLSWPHCWRFSTPHNQPSARNSDIYYHFQRQSATQRQRCIRPLQPREWPTWPPSPHRYSGGVTKPVSYCLSCYHQSWPHSQYSYRCHSITNRSVTRITHHSGPQLKGVTGHQKGPETTTTWRLWWYVLPFHTKSPYRVCYGHYSPDFGPLVRGVRLIVTPGSCR